jgi:hypothetical protein
MDAVRRLILVSIDYPRSSDNPDTVQVDLCDVRAADGIRVKYDFSRDGWLVLQGRQARPGEVGDDWRDDWTEKAFVPAWGRV